MALPVERKVRGKCLRTAGGWARLSGRGLRRSAGLHALNSALGPLSHVASWGQLPPRGPSPGPSGCLGHLLDTRPSENNTVF